MLHEHLLLKYHVDIRTRNNCLFSSSQENNNYYYYSISLHYYSKTYIDLHTRDNIIFHYPIDIVIRGQYLSM